MPRKSHLKRKSSWLGTGPEWDHLNEPVPDRNGTEWFDRVVDRYRDEPDRNYRDLSSVPFHYIPG
ncbi:hypothetical protein H5410_008058 [Solanum commersonii]|uniref:Uncharacterized protein n=1 Tax=Solanum commersonii TaxID=4109 RepID=A0A9J6AE52_SOLCO|nr:hypothetical protein H5410_008058 [Solanum commersonii]